MNRIALGLVAMGAAAIFVSTCFACGRDPSRSRSHEGEADEAPRAADTPAQAYAARCEACHGKAGRGDGPTAATLLPRPRSFADPAWQAATTDDGIRKVIVGGGPAVSKSQLMPSNPDLSKDPLMISGLVAIVRGFGPAPQTPPASSTQDAASH